MLARAWAQLGFEQKHRDEAKRALDLARELPRADHMLVEGEYYASVGNMEQAASVYDALYELFPDNVDYGLRFADAEAQAGNASHAEDVIHRLRALPPPSSDDPRIDLAEAAAIKENRPASLALVRSAVSKASAQGKKIVYALARRDECMNMLYADHPQQASSVCEDAYEIFISSGNRLGAADAMRLIGDYHGSVGQIDQAISDYEKALGLLRALGEHEKTGAILNNMAVDYANQGNLGRSEQLYRDAKSHFEYSGDKQNEAVALCNIADILYLRGELNAAAKTYQQSLDLIATIDHGDPGYAMYRMADLSLTQGNVREAKKLAERSVEVFKSTQGNYQSLSQAVVELGEVLKAEGDLASAHQQFLTAQDLQKKVGDIGLVQESVAELADLALEEGHPEQAESLIRSTIAEYEKEKSDPALASCYTILSEALLKQGKVEESRQAAERALHYSQTSSDPALKLPAVIQNALAEIAWGPVGSLDTAMQALREAAATAKRLGYFNLECEARLALGKAQLKNNAGAARAQLVSLVSDARAHSFGLIVRRAEEELQNGSSVLAVAGTSR